MFKINDVVTTIHESELVTGRLGRFNNKGQLVIIANDNNETVVADSWSCVLVRRPHTEEDLASLDIDSELLAMNEGDLYEVLAQARKDTHFGDDLERLYAIEGKAIIGHNLHEMNKWDMIIELANLGWYG